MTILGCVFALMYIFLSPVIKYNKQFFKFIHKFYLTPGRVHKFSNDNLPNCPRCRIAEGSFMHLFLQCEKLTSFWNSVHTFTICALDIEFNEKNPCLYLLNAMPDLSLDKRKCRILIMIKYFAKKCILLLWKDNAPPTFKFFLQYICRNLFLKYRTILFQGSLNFAESQIHWSQTTITLKVKQSDTGKRQTWQWGKSYAMCLGLTKASSEVYCSGMGK